MNEGTTATCGTCKHWHKGPADPQNLGQPTKGECRESPPQLTILPQGHQMLRLVAYPDMPPECPACSKHATDLVS